MSDVTQNISAQEQGDLVAAEQPLPLFDIEGTPSMGRTETMQDRSMTRRQLLEAAVAGTAVLAVSGRGQARAAGVPAALGGQPVRTAPFPRWPAFREADEQAVLPVLRSGVWSRSKVVDEAEKRFARLMGAKHCLATCNGTNAIITSLWALGIGAGDEVITTPYTFVGTIQPILLAGALPVFADIDPDTWQIDPARIEAKINSNTAAILPVHIIGGVCDMDRINAILEREGEVLEILLFKLVETRLLLENDELRFLSRSTREVERARTRAREIDLMRATTVSQHRPGVTLRDLATESTGPWPGIFRDHHDVLTSLVAEIEVTAHQNSGAARLGLEALQRAKVPAGTAEPADALEGTGNHGDAELARLARGAAFESVLGTASRLRMPDLLDFLR